MTRTPRGFACPQHNTSRPRTERHRYDPRPPNQLLPRHAARFRIAQLLDIQSSLRSELVWTSI